MKLISDPYLFRGTAKVGVSLEESPLEAFDVADHLLLVLEARFP